MIVLLNELEPADHWVRKAFERSVIDRVEFRTQTADPPSYLELVASADIALDAAPFTGHTSTCDALWMGVPVVTLAGDAYWKRMSASVLTHMKLEELIAESPEQYVERAASLASDPLRLATLRHALRPRMQASSITDARRFTADLEAAYGQMWAQYAATSP